jgi:tRNA pseudouridine55 synthase
MQAGPSGILLVDKPVGLSSAAVVARVKRSLRLRKVGHAGTLDPFATGLLVICINRATRLMQFLVDGQKRYEAELMLGVETDTQDLTGQITASAETVNVKPAALFEILKQFKGTISQTPPVYSALKHKGMPLYRLARKGKPVQKPDRTVTIRQLDILEIDLPKVRFAVECSAGTYVRTLGVDIGRALGCGGHLSALRRTASSGFNVKDALSLDMLEDEDGRQQVLTKMIALTDAIKQMPSFTADNKLAVKLKFGQKITVDDIELENRAGDEGHSTNGWVKIVTPDQRLLAVLDFNQKNKSFDYCCSFAD